jgi:hypothetical protein
VEGNVFVLFLIRSKSNALSFGNATALSDRNTAALYYGKTTEFLKEQAPAEPPLLRSRRGLGCFLVM